jgi:hypothetical protein
MLTTSNRGGVIPILHLIMSNIKRITLVSCDMVRKEITPGVMWVIFIIDGRARRYLRRGMERINIVGFAIIFPWDNSSFCKRYANH